VLDQFHRCVVPARSYTMSAFSSTEFNEAVNVDRSGEMSPEISVTDSSGGFFGYPDEKSQQHVRSGQKTAPTSED
jgi:hypothetical protein